MVARKHLRFLELPDEITPILCQFKYMKNFYYFSSIYVENNLIAFLPLQSYSQNFMTAEALKSVGAEEKM